MAKMASRKTAPMAMGMVRPWLQMMLRRDQAEHHADAVHAEDDAALGKTEILQPVVDVLVIRMKEREPAQAAPDEGEGRIEDRHAQAHHRHEHDGGDGALVGTGQGKRRDAKADEVRPAIPQVDAGGREIEDEEAEERAGHGKGIPGHRLLLVEPADDAERDRHEKPEAARQAIEPIDQVHDVRHRDEPEHGQEEAQPARDSRSRRRRGRSSRSMRRPIQ